MPASLEDRFEALEERVRKLELLVKVQASFSMSIHNTIRDVDEGFSERWCEAYAFWQTEQFERMIHLEADLHDGVERVRWVAMTLCEWADRMTGQPLPIGMSQEIKNRVDFLLKGDAIPETKGGIDIAVRSS